MICYLFLLHQISRCRSNHLEWGALPARLIDQVENYLLPVEALLDLAYPPHLIHADITGDHLLGRINNEVWHSLGIIDWGDAMSGDLFYELQALYLDLFRCDREMLRPSSKPMVCSQVKSRISPTGPCA
jgi:aminoglycoside phosphotransferase (APT) family kinase protein